MPNQLTVNIEGLELIMQRTFDAPRELVFRAYSDPDALAQWWGPKGWTLPVCDMDFRPGGRWHYCMQGPDGERSCGVATYKEIKVPERIVYDDTFADADGKPTPGMPQMHITVELLAQGDKTLLVSHTLFDSKEELEKVVEMGVEEGFAQTWDRLAVYLFSQQ